MQEFYHCVQFPISRDPPEGGTREEFPNTLWIFLFPISRDPPEGGTCRASASSSSGVQFPISRDPPEGGTIDERLSALDILDVSNF